jgi:hypothetical protein
MMNLHTVPDGSVSPCGEGGPTGPLRRLSPRGEGDEPAETGS